MDNKKPVTINLPPETIAKMERIKKKIGASKNWQIEKGLELYFKKVEKDNSKPAV